MGATMTRNRSLLVRPTRSSHWGKPAGEMRFFTVAAVAEILGVSTRTVRRWIKSGDLVAHHFGAAVRIAESDLKAFIARQRDP